MNDEAHCGVSWSLGWRHTGSVANVEPLDSNDGALVAAISNSEESPNARGVPSLANAAPEAQTSRSPSDIVSSARDLSNVMTSGAMRISRIVPLGSGEEQVSRDAADLRNGADDDPGTAAPAARRDSDVVRKPDPDGDPLADEPIVASPMVDAADPRDVRASSIVPDFVDTRLGPGFPDDEDEATMVDAGAALTEDERDALARRIHTAMQETAPHGTPPPLPVQPLEAGEPGRERRPFKQTILLGTPYRDSPMPPAAQQSPEPAVMASLVRVVGPPTQPPPRRSRRVPPLSPSEQSEADADEPDHEAFVLTHTIVTPDPPKPPAPPPPSKRTPEGAIRYGEPPARPAEPPPLPPEVPLSTHSGRFAAPSSRASLPSVMLPPAPQPEDFELASSPAMTALAPPLRATIEPSASLARTRPPMSSMSEHTFPMDTAFDELPAADPFAGFVAPPPSLAQRWLVVIVVALAVVGLCSLAAIAFGFLGKTGW
jgi:hypothetical protein